MWLRMIGVGLLIGLLGLLAACGQTDSDRIHGNDPSGTFRTPPAASDYKDQSPNGNGAASSAREQGGGQVGGGGESSGQSSGGQTGADQGNGPAPCPTTIQLAFGNNPPAVPVGCGTVTPIKAVATP